MDLSNPNDWSGPYEYSLPHPNIPFNLVQSFSAEIIAVNVSSTTAKDTWVTGGWLSQILKIEFDDTYYNWTAFSQRVRLGGNIVVFPNNYASYGLQFSFPYWFQDGLIIIWVYKKDV